MMTPQWIGAIIVAAMLPGCARQETYEKPLTPVKVQEIGVAADPGGIRYSAAIEPKTRVDLAFKVPGYIGMITSVRGADGRPRVLQEGDRVTRGMLLARIRQDDVDVKVGQTRSQVAETDAALAQTKAALDRATELLARKSITKPDYDAAKAAYDTVIARAQGARAVVQEAENAVADSSMLSPLDGVILKRLIEVGSLVGAGTPGFVVADTSSVKVVFGAPDVMMRTLKAGTEQRVVSEAFPGVVFLGRITRISPLADVKSRAFDIEITIPNQTDRLKVGMVASLEIANRQALEPALVVPLAAVIRSKNKPDGYAVFVVETRGAQTVTLMRDVALGEMYGSQIAVTSGLKAGDRVVVSGATIVVDGETVSVTD